MQFIGSQMNVHSNTTKKSLMKTDLQPEDNKKGNVNEGEMD